LRFEPTVQNQIFLAMFFNIEISGLPDRFPMKIEENVNLKRKAPEERVVG